MSEVPNLPMMYFLLPWVPFPKAPDFNLQVTWFHTKIPQKTSYQLKEYYQSNQDNWLWDHL